MKFWEKLWILQSVFALPNISSILYTLAKNAMTEPTKCTWFMVFLAGVYKIEGIFGKAKHKIRDFIICVLLCQIFPQFYILLLKIP